MVYDIINIPREKEKRKMEYFEDDREIDSKDAAIVFKEDGSLRVIIPSDDDTDDDTDDEVGSNVLVAVALSGLLLQNDEIKELIMNEIDRMKTKYALDEE